MFSRFRIRLFALPALAALLGGCERESGHTQGGPTEPAPPILASSDTIFPGNATPPPLDPRTAAYEGNAAAIAKGQQLFTWMNCVGCHSHGGGGMGPALMDGKWRYGGRIDQIAASIYQGRPNGMPAWRDKLNSQQIWQLAAYVRSLSGQVPKDAVSARADTMSNTPPQTQTKRQPAIEADSAQQ
jgi:cytochrome c oxidase cbb3-type subunit 3